jgi:hypothetical protein
MSIYWVDCFVLWFCPLVVIIVCTLNRPLDHITTIDSMPHSSTHITTIAIAIAIAIATPPLPASQAAKESLKAAHAKTGGQAEWKLVFNGGLPACAHAQRACLVECVRTSSSYVLACAHTFLNATTTHSV